MAAPIATGSSVSLGRRVRPRLAVPLLLLVALALRAPLLSPIPVNWDAAQFALGVSDFTVAGHQPHPPGYPLFILAGWLLNHLVGDASLSLSLISWLASGLTVAAIAILGRATVGRRAGWIAALLYAVSPLAGYYGIVGLSYSVEVLFATLAIWQLRRAMLGRPTGLILAALLLGVGAGFRPTMLILLAPVVLWVAWRRPLGERLPALFVLFLSVGWWAVPLIALSGGMALYFDAVADLAQRVLAGTSGIGAFWQIAVNVQQVILVLLLATQAAAAFVVLAFRRSGPAFRLAPDVRGLFLWWAVPPLLVFLFVHFGQPGYLLIIVPPILLVLSRAIEWFSLGLAVELRQPPTRLLGGMVAGLVLTGLSLFVWGNDPLSVYELEAARTDWQALQGLVGGMPARTVVVTGGTPAGSYRVAEVLLPGRDVRAIGTNDGTVVEYGRSGDRRAAGPTNRPFDPTPGVGIVAIDDEAAALLQIPLRPVTLPKGRTVWIADPAAAR